ncbi:MAG TPA: polyprenyl synthetase family protein [Phycisphaerales bacterium]|nr:polyprenyl synthetase family protein [Phycisphaerales bacterium]
MNIPVSIPQDVEPVQHAIMAAMDRVRGRFDDQLASELPPVHRLVQHVEHYRGKMLRPMLVLASGLAAHPLAIVTPAAELSKLLTDSHTTVAAVCEMVHMATLVHDDVLDEADTRRRGKTVNRLHGNETAVILGDLLISSAFHLCSQLQSQRSSLIVGRVSMEMCAGELLQLHHRGDFSLDEPTYYEIVERKTAALIAASCELGAMHSGAPAEHVRALADFGRRVGIAFQIQDDVLDLTGREDVVGKSVGKDLEKAKLTLPVIHHLCSVSLERRGTSLKTLEEACGEGPSSRAAAAAMVELLRSTDSLNYAMTTARSLVEQAQQDLGVLSDAPARSLLWAMAGAAVNRAF